MIYYCDANFIISYLLASNPKDYSKTKKVFNLVQTGKTSVILEQAIFTETVTILSDHYKVPRDKIAEVLSKLLTYKGIICDQKDILLQALDIYTDRDLHISDCLLVVKASKGDNVNIFSFNQGLLDPCTNKSTIQTE